MLKTSIDLRCHKKSELAICVVKGARNLLQSITQYGALLNLRFLSSEPYDHQCLLDSNQEAAVI